MVPPALKRPFLSWVAPRKTAAKAGSRYGVPAVGEPPPRIEASTMPVAPASTPGRHEREELQPADLDAGQPRGVGLKPTA